MRAIAVLVAVLFLGCFIGATGSWLRYGKNTNVQAAEKQETLQLLPQRQEQRLPELIGMTPDQKAQFEDVMRESRQELDSLSREQRLKIDTVIMEANKKIRSILDGEQKTKLETFLEDVDRRREHGSRGERGSGSQSPGRGRKTNNR
jgi:Spy/CpxP family protein refolding chaperone